MKRLPEGERNLYCSQQICKIDIFLHCHELLHTEFFTELPGTERFSGRELTFFDQVMDEFIESSVELKLIYNDVNFFHIKARLLVF